MPGENGSAGRGSERIRKLREDLAPRPAGSGSQKGHSEVAGHRCQRETRPVNRRQRKGLLILILLLHPRPLADWNRSPLEFPDSGLCFLTPCIAIAYPTLLAFAQNQIGRPLRC